MSFNADFIVIGDGAFANQNIVFNDNSSIGVLVDSDSLSIDGNVNKNDLTLSDYVVTKITKYQWFFADGNFYYDNQVIHKFKEPGNVPIKLTIWSETFVFGGETFYFTHTITKEITVQSRFYKFLTDNFPIWDNIKNPYYDAIMVSAGKFFDQLHAKISGIYNLNDINKIDPNFFEVLAQTLGHDSYYRKVGYNISAGNFDNYDIIDRITNNIATIDETNSFRIFLSKSADIFKKKGTPQDVINFLSFFAIDGEPVDLWTQNFGKTTKGITVENFSELNFDDNLLTLSWDGIDIFGSKNDLAHLIKKDSSIILDSYYKVQKYEQNASVFTAAPVINRVHPDWRDIYEMIRYVKEVLYIGDTNFTPIENWLTPNEVSNLVSQIYSVTPWYAIDVEVEQNRIIFDDHKTFLIKVADISGNCVTTEVTSANFVKYLPSMLVRDVRLNTGSLIDGLITGEDLNTYLVDWRSTFVSGGSVVVDVTALPLSGYFQYFPFLQVQNFMEMDSLLEQGERMSVSFLVSNDNDIESSIITKNYRVKDFDANLIFKFIEPEKLTYNLKVPDNQVNILFRGDKISNVDKFSVEKYYKATFNGKNKTFSISKIIPNVDNTIVQQKINLSGDRNNILFDKIIYDIDENGNNINEEFFVEYDKLYEIKVSVTNSLVSVWIRRRTIESELYNDITIGVGNNNLGKNIQPDPWIVLVENLDLNASQENVTSFNEKDQVINTLEYSYINTEGLIGFGCKDSLVSISKFIINNRDLDTTLYTTVDKQILLKPKYLDWQRQRDIILASYDNSVPFFDNFIVSGFDPNIKIYQLTNEEASSLQTIYFNNIIIDDKLATRYTVQFNTQWLNDNYNFEGKLDPSFYNKIIIPFGKQHSSFITENPIFDEGIYKNSQGNDTTGTVGMFFANNSPIFGLYETKPQDDFSSTTRDGSGFGHHLYTNDRIAQYKLSGRDIGFLGVYEEIFPKSNYFTELDGKLILEDQSVFKNNFFNPVIVDTDCGKRTIGVRFRNCKDILTTIKNYSTELNKEIYIYGNFTFHVPKFSVKFAPDYNFTDSKLLSDYVQINVFMPLGILNEHIKTYTLGKQFTKEFGGMIISLDGIYIRLNSDQVSYAPSSGIITLNKLNKYENKYNNLSSRYWLSAKLDLAASVRRDTDPNLNTSDKEINFFINNDLRKILTSLEDTKTYSISADYQWWLPKGNEIWSGVYRKRDFDIITVDLSNDLTTNLNYYGYNGNPIVDCQEQRDRASSKIFFGNQVGGFKFSLDASLIPHTQCVTANEPLKAIQIRLTDADQNNPILPNTTYYAKITVKINYSGIDQKNIDVMSDNERLKIKILGTNKKEKFKKAPVVKCHEFYMPFAWYDSNHVPSGNQIQFADYIRGAYGHGSVPSITFSPLGLLTELLNNMEEIDKEIILDSDIDFTTWNKYLLDNMSIDYIIEPIPSNVCSLYKNYGIFNVLNLNIGSFAEIEYNKSNLEWDVTEKFRYFFNGTQENFFTLPNQINTIESWIQNIRKVTLNNYVLDSSLYSISLNNILTLSEDTSFQFLNGSNMIGKYMLNLYLNVFNINKNNFTFEEFVQDFNTKNDISFVPYESTSLIPYTIVERAASESLAFKSSDKLFDIIPVAGFQAMRVNMDNTRLDTVHGKAGSFNEIKKINFNLSNMPDLQKLFMIDEDSPVFDVETMVYFDEELDKIGDYRGKKLEFIVKANSTYDVKSQKYILSEYYFVGIGTYDFDVSLGVAKYNKETATLDKSFLVGFGDYNTKNIKSNTWYKLRVIATKSYIRVIFNEEKQPERLIINYNVAPQNSDIAGINSGKYEELVYVVKGLGNLDITYLNKVGEKTGKDFVEANINTVLAFGKRPAGFLTGISVTNQFTYVTNIKYRIQKPKIRKFSNVSDGEDLTVFLTTLKEKYGDYSEVKFIGKTLNNTLVVHLDDSLYYRNSLGHPIRYIQDNVVEVELFKNFVIITTILNNSMNVIVVSENFNKEYNVFFKDNNFNIDQIYRYLAFTQRTIDAVYVDSGQMSIVLNN